MAVELLRGTADEWFSQSYCGIRKEVSRGRIVRAIEYDIIRFQKRKCILREESRLDRDDLCSRINSAERSQSE